ncbi:MAG: thermonuclease family protein [Proteobacteria bacterium]|nr:thermonuclease family protein [Pseudomonadota bacterium]
MKLFACYSLLLLLLFPGPVFSEPANTGIVSKVFDGDSLIVSLAPGRSVEIRLAEIDAPEKDQPFGDRSRDELRNLIDGEPVRIEIYDIDAYGRLVAHIYRLRDQLHVNSWMVGHGLAWVYPKYAEDERLFALEKSARGKSIGLWSLPPNQQIPPWKWRHKKQ